MLPVFMDIDLQWFLRASGKGVAKVATGHMSMNIGFCVRSTSDAQYLTYHKFRDKGTPFTKGQEKLTVYSPRFHADLYLYLATTQVQPLVAIPDNILTSQLCESIPHFSWVKGLHQGKSQGMYLASPVPKALTLGVVVTVVVG